MTGKEDVARKELEPAVNTAIEVGIRLGAIALLVVACVMIMAPFVDIVLWAGIVAIAADRPFETLCRWMGGRRKLTAALALTVTLLILLVPTVRLTGTLVVNAREVARDVKEGTVRIPAPDARVAEWPVVGPKVFEGWTLASENLREAVGHVEPQLQAVAQWLLRVAAGAVGGILKLLASALIAAVLLVQNDARQSVMEMIAVRMAGPQRGPELSRLANATVRSVVQGIVGVAVLQSILAGIGFMIAGIPGAGLWALLVLVAAIVQLPVSLAVIPPILIAYSTMGGAPATVFAIWSVAVSLLDNLLKPMLFGRGVEVPSLVVFIGAIGGMLTMGIVGLFLGAVVLAVGFALFRAWLQSPGAPATA